MENVHAIQFQSVSVDVRIIAATHQNLEQRVAEGKFREDLYYRLNVVPLHLPPLKDRAEDIPELSQHFIKKASKEGLRAKTIDDQAMTLMLTHYWPGNVRELENMIRRLLVLVDDDVIKSHHIHEVLTLDQPTKLADEGHQSQRLMDAAALHINRFFDSHHGDLPASGLYQRVLEEVEKPLIMATLRATSGNQIKAAEVLGVNRNTLRKKITTLGLDHDLKDLLRR